MLLLVNLQQCTVQNVSVLALLNKEQTVREWHYANSIWDQRKKQEKHFPFTTF